MEGGSVDELLYVTVERPVLDQLQVEVGRSLEDRVRPGLTGDDGECQLYVVDEDRASSRVRASSQIWRNAGYAREKAPPSRLLFGERARRVSCSIRSASGRASRVVSLEAGTGRRRSISRCH